MVAKIANNVACGFTTTMELFTTTMELTDGFEGNDLGFIAVLSGLRTGIQIY